MAEFKQFPAFQLPGIPDRWYTADYFEYNIGPGAGGAAGALAAGAVAFSSFTVQKDANFEWVYTTFFATLDGSTPPDVDNIQVPVSVLITDGGSGRILMNQAVPISSLAGCGRQPYVLPQCRYLMGASTINFNWTNFGAVKYDNISLTLHGRKLFDVS